MSLPELIDQTAAVAAALAALGVRHHDRVLIMLPAAAVQAGARLVLGSPDQIHALAELDAEPAVLVDGPHGPWAAAMRLR